MAGEGAERHGKGREHGRRPVRIADDDLTSVRREFEGEKRYSPGREQQAVESVLSDDAAGDDELAGGGFSLPPLSPLPNASLKSRTGNEVSFSNTSLFQKDDSLCFPFPLDNPL